VTEAPPGPPPSLDEARSWVGRELDEVGGQRVGRVTGLYADAQSGTPAWLVVAIERRRRFRRSEVRAVAVPVRECAAMPGRAWTAEPARALLDAPVVDPSRPLLREHEEAICAHYGIGEGIGRHAELVDRSGGAATALPV